MVVFKYRMAKDWLTVLKMKYVNNLSIDQMVFSIPPKHQIILFTFMPIRVNLVAFSGTVHHVHQCREAVKWIKKVEEEYFCGAPNTSNSGAPKFPVVIGIAITDWSDGFGSGKCKNNRNAVDLKTMTAGVPKDRVNSSDNTLPVAIGLKKAKGWSKVEHLFQKELEEMTDPSQPIPQCHGGVQKVFPVACHRFAVITDRVERKDKSGTLGHGGDTHRCYGFAGKIETPSCKVQKLTAFLAKEAQGKLRKKVTWGWLEEFVSRAGKANGAVFPSCINCRKYGLRKLGIEFADDGDDLPSGPAECDMCFNWNLQGRMNNNPLQFPRHDDYPTRYTEGSPVPPPNGRDVFKEGKNDLPFLKMDWGILIQASKFAFFQASRPKNWWKKPETVCYLKSCGISGDIAAKVWEVARACAKKQEQENVNYNRREGIGELEWPASWLSSEVSLRGYVEAIMHVLFLGVEESKLLGRQRRRRHHDGRESGLATAISHSHEST